MKAKTHYETDEFGQLFQVCPNLSPKTYRGIPRIGSISCQQCEHNEGFDNKEHWIICGLNPNQKEVLISNTEEEKMTFDMKHILNIRFDQTVYTKKQCLYVLVPYIDSDLDERQQWRPATRQESEYILSKYKENK